MQKQEILLCMLLLIRKVQSIICRQTLSFILLFPLGFFMGIPFPTGIKLLERYNARIIPWAWCINGCSSVVSSVLVILIALTFGFKIALFLSAAAYTGGFLVFASKRNKEF